MAFILNLLRAAVHTGGPRRLRSKVAQHYFAFSHAYFPDISKFKLLQWKILRAEAWDLYWTVVTTHHHHCYLSYSYKNPCSGLWCLNQNKSSWLYCTGSWRNHNFTSSLKVSVLQLYFKAWQMWTSTSVFIQEIISFEATSQQSENIT